MARASIADIEALVAGDTAPKAFLRTVAAHGEAVALRRARPDGSDGWEEWTFAEYAALVAAAAAGLAAAGTGPGDKVVLMMANRPEFHVLDTAAQFLRATPFSIYNSSSPEEIAYQVGHSDATVAVVEAGSLLDRFTEAHAQLNGLRHIFVVGGTGAATGTGDGDGRGARGPSSAQPYEALFEHGSADLADLAAATEPSDLATLIYTSGTTGPPKGVMITQYNVVYTTRQLLSCMETDIGVAGWRTVSYLPMAHIAERMSSHYLQLVGGTSVTTCPEMTAVAAYATQVRPEVMFGVPRVWEKIYAGVNAALAADPEKAQKFNEGVAAALPIVAARRNGTITPAEQEVWDFLDAVAFSTVRQLVGLDAVRVAISGAAPIPREVLEWFNAIGVPLSEIYGMSESSGPMTWDPYANRPGWVGRAIPGCEVVLADDGEVLCRGGNVFSGYYKDPAKTADTLIDGWLHSGDIGELDGDGYLRIVDRKKELIITAGGKNVSPANLEAALKGIPLIGQAAAIGDNRRFISALLVLDGDVAPAWAHQAGVAFTSLADLAADPAVVAEVQRGVDAVNERFAQAEQVRKFILIGEEWQVGSDVMTPTAKLKRRGINARYAAQIEALYA